MDADERYMWLALDLAAKGLGGTSPNPVVGAVIVKGGEVISTGYHQQAGGPHAEVIALDAAGEAARGATLYVTLEPCSHTGRTPPCVDKIIESGIRKVVVAMGDPNPLVNGRGLEKLRAAGIKVKSDVLDDKSARLNEVFVKYITTNKPFVTMKAAMTLDGKIATRTKASRWISSEKSREFGHRLRHHNDAIMVGVGTVLADNPSLTTRLPEGGHNPLRIIVDSKAATPLHAKVIAQSPESTLLFVTEAASPDQVESLRNAGADVVILTADADGRVPLEEMMLELGRREITSVLVEGGSTLNFSLLAGELVDKVYFFIAPLIFGGVNAPSPVGGGGVDVVANAWKVNNIEISRYESDLLVTGYIEYTKEQDKG
ncbi:MAG: bifunctional diaminohydroxyphosphoribosylaminopyrimidine deaminase/5-amino-6-(5-phosphoribosylamino)uracil reductase RibD [Clostridiales bacterium]|jgi:diaminohydroxyphosphoribosylaminopyrimidine deaminase/5-amino-6-(5-phosphoribosylamino)uracil reductase|nr:bifunctional diaminohydroxyphosphoribosylaminopyrimidine deaminase/5-amino-6-(5-phosphoribosylamino)uracil reductase RibD [Clostridiales bacterium]